MRRLEDHFTAQAFITTDIDDNQITAFHPGAMSQSHREPRRPRRAACSLAIVSPDGRQGMVEHARDLARGGIPYVLDPGQGLPMFSGEDVLGDAGGRARPHRERLRGAHGRAEDRQARSPSSPRTVEAVVVTRGGEGRGSSSPAGSRCDVPAVKPDSLVDPTGCGDAFRAGLLYGMARGWGWREVRRGSPR